MEIFQMFEQHKNEEQALTSWHGTFKDFLNFILSDPVKAKRAAFLAPARLFDMIEAAGIEVSPDGHKKYNFFDKDLYGIGPAIEKIMEEYLRPASDRLDVRKRVLLLMGPVSGGKSSLVTLLKKGLEQHSRTERGAIYAIDGCPMHETPFHLVPDEMRKNFQNEYGIYIEGQLCPVCQQRLELEFKGDRLEFPIHRILISEKKRVGIGTFTPSDPKSQDIADLTGSMNFSKIGEYGSESDPRAYSFDGELNKANRGVMEFIEMLKCDEKFLWNLLTVSQEGNFKAGRFALIDADEMIIAHTNETEYRSFNNNPKNEALRSRIIVHRVPYNLRVSDEVRIYEKLIKQGNLPAYIEKELTPELRAGGNYVHIAPNALKSAAMYTILTRLKPSHKQDISLVAKMRLYDGQGTDRIQPDSPEVDEIRREGWDMEEGMSGVDPRYIINRIAAAASKAQSSGTRCITPISVIKNLREGLEQHPSMSKEEREESLKFLHGAKEEFNAVAMVEVQRAFIASFEDSAQQLCNNYLDNVESYVEDRRMKNAITDEEVPPDERLMRSIEEQIGVSEAQKRAFREEIMVRIGTFSRSGRTFNYASHAKLKEAIEKKLFNDLKDSVKITTSVKNPDEKQLRKFNSVATRLIDDHGYCPTCAEELLKYVGSLLNR